MVIIEDKHECTGCGACYNKCPKGCIKLVEDSEGFWYPDINKELCINCNLCNRVCPLLQRANKDAGLNLESFLAFSIDDRIRMSSSSGGIFSEIAQFVLNARGVVFGCAFDKHMLAYHVGINSIEQLDKLVGSKYLQSRTEDTFKEAEKLLRQHTPVLYVGTACQIAGLKKYLDYDYSELYTVDILCHGVVTPKLWRKYLDDLEKKYNSSIEKIEFRNKHIGWKNFSIYARFSNGKEYLESFLKDKYMQMFLSNICLRPSCYTCKFKSIPHEADITIGDAWGIENHSPEMDDDKGTSVVIINSEKGKIIYNNIEPRIRAKKVDLDKALPLSSDSRKPVNENIKREFFFRMLNKNKSVMFLYRISRKPFLIRTRALLFRVLRRIKRCIFRIL